jgi:hypothetical protein
MTMALTPLRLHDRQTTFISYRNPHPRRKTLHSPQADFAMAFKPITGVCAAIERLGQL